MSISYDFDFIIVGSGFGGSVSALRLAEKGYKVLVIEKGKRLGPKEFPKSNWQIKKWLWVPFLKFFGLFKITLFRHIGVLSGVGVGGGSLVYGNTLAIPPKRFFEASSWGHLNNWQEDLKPHYERALIMLGAADNPRFETGDLALKQLADEIGMSEHFGPTKVAVYFGEPGVTKPDPYFDGHGPARTGCNFCGGCFLGCRFNAKNTLDKNYLYLAEKLGAQIQPETEVTDVLPTGGGTGSDGYEVFVRSISHENTTSSYRTKKIIFAGGVLGTIKLLLRLKESSLKRLSDCLGQNIRTNSESLIGVTTFDKNKSFSDGIAIGSVLHTDENSFVEPTRYSAGSGFWRILMSPMVSGGNAISRLGKVVIDFIKHPIQNLKMFFIDDWSRRTQILLFMQTIDSTLTFTKSLFGMRSRIGSGEAPSAFIPEANGIAKRFAKIVNGKPAVLLQETIFGIPTTAHILGGATMGLSAADGVIDKNHQVFGYENMWICDGSTISANPGVNPSLTITALTERAMSLIPDKQ